MTNFNGPVLLVAAHPDDETLGCGGTMAKMSFEGSLVYVAFIADGVSSRQDDDESLLATRRRAASQACNILGAQPPTFDDLPDNQLDTVPLLRIVRTVESLIDRYKPKTVFTHHAGDVNIDHRRIHEAVVAACRPQPGHPVNRLLFFEVASSTEWQPPGSSPVFAPSVFVEISRYLDRKLEALNAYKSEMRSWPHPRSLKAVEHHARYRGAIAGMEAAEAFVLGRELNRCK